jgi:hypothetical protein
MSNPFLEGGTNYSRTAAFARNVSLLVSGRITHAEYVTRGWSQITANGIVPPNLAEQIRLLGLDGLTPKELQVFIDALKEIGVDAVIREQEYKNTLVVGAYFFGIQIGGVTVWFTGNIGEPTAPINLMPVDPMAKVGVSVSVKENVADKLIEVRATDAVDTIELDWFGRFASIPSNQRQWLLTQLEANFARIGQSDLYDELVSKL